jgi:RNA polymerase sigma factor (sigma-70 family)
MGAVMTNSWVEFPSTRHSLIRGAKAGGRTCQRTAIDNLCRRYQQPVYSFIRRAWSKSTDDAQDLTQAFFLHLLEKDALAAYDPARGCFRVFLKSILRHVAADIHDAERAKKRGGGARKISLEDDGGDLRLNQCLEDPRALDPEEAFDEAWKREVLERAIERTRAWFASRDWLVKFQVFEATLAGDTERPTYSAIAARFGLRECVVRNHLFEVRERIRAEARAEIAQTVGDERQLEDEYRSLIGS